MIDATDVPFLSPWAVPAVGESNKVQNKAAKRVSPEYYNASSRSGEVLTVPSFGHSRKPPRQKAKKAALYSGALGIEGIVVSISHIVCSSEIILSQKIHPRREYEKTV